MGGAGGWVELRDWWNWGMGGAGGWVELGMGGVGDGWSSGGVFFFMSLFFYSNGVYSTKRGGVLHAVLLPQRCGILHSL